MTVNESARKFAKNPPQAQWRKPCGPCVTVSWFSEKISILCYSSWGGTLGNYVLRSIIGEIVGELGELDGRLECIQKLQSSSLPDSRDTRDFCANCNFTIFRINDSAEYHNTPQRKVFLSSLRSQLSNMPTRDVREDRIREFLNRMLSKRIIMGGSLHQTIGNVDRPFTFQHGRSKKPFVTYSSFMESPSLKRFLR